MDIVVVCRSNPDSPYSLKTIEIIPQGCIPVWKNVLQVIWGVSGVVLRAWGVFLRIWYHGSNPGGVRVRPGRVLGGDCGAGSEPRHRHPVQSLPDHAACEGSLLCWWWNTAHFGCDLFVGYGAPSSQVAGAKNQAGCWVEEIEHFKSFIKISTLFPDNPTCEGGGCQFFFL